MPKHITLLQNNQDCIENKINGFSKGKRKVFNFIIGNILKYRTSCPSQAFIGTYAKITRVHSNRLLQELALENYISIINRGFKKTCIYKLNELFYSPTIAFRLRHILPAIWLSWNLTLIAAAGADLSKNVTQLKVNLNYNIYIKSLANKQHKLSYLSTKKIVGDISHQLQNGWNENIKSIVRGEKVMEAMISPQIEAIKTLNLTLAGKIALMSFPDEAILWADQTFARRKGILEPFSYFRNLCMRYCSENKIAVDWSLVTKLNSYYKIVESSPFLEKKAVNKQPITQKAANYQSKPTNALKQESRRPVAWRDSDTRFKAGCWIDHEAELEKFFSEKFQNQLNRNIAIGFNSAQGYFDRLIANHKECLEKNHKKNEPEWILDINKTAIKDEPPATDYCGYEEDINDIMIDL